MKFYTLEIKDVFLTLRQRAKIVNEADADLLFQFTVMLFMTAQFTDQKLLFTDYT